MNLPVEKTKRSAHGTNSESDAKKAITDTPKDTPQTTEVAELEETDIPIEFDHDRFFLEHQQLVKTSTGEYRNQRFVGKGGNGTTFLVTGVRGPLIGVQLALKVFHRISNNQRRSSFLNEIERYKTLDHPAIIRFYDEGEYKVRDREDKSRERVYPFVLVEYVPQNLRQFLLEHSRKIDRITAMRFVMGVAAALKYLHELTVPLVHRDIKPANILISGDKARLADFGLAKSFEEATADEPQLARDEMAYAAMPKFYRSPELVRRAKGDTNSPLTPASDIYQLGTVLYEVITGFNPQARPEDLTDEIKLHLREIPGGCGDRLYDLIQRMLATDASKRPTASSVLDELLLIHEDYCSQMKQITGQYV